MIEKYQKKYKTIAISSVVPIEVLADCRPVPDQIMRRIFLNPLCIIAVALPVFLKRMNKKRLKAQPFTQMLPESLFISCFLFLYFLIFTFSSH